MYAGKGDPGITLAGKAAGVVKRGLAHGRTERLTPATVVKIACAAKGAMANRVETESACETISSVSLLLRSTSCSDAGIGELSLNS